MKTCQYCLQSEYKVAFFNNITCLPCRRQRVREQNAKTRRNNRRRSRCQNLQRRYGILEADYIRMYVAQHGQCALCNKKQDQLEVDHCHKTLSVRMLLCNECNVGLAMFKDNPEVLLKAIEYLKKDWPKPTNEQLFRIIG